jgi:tagaturonate reductase
VDNGKKLKDIVIQLATQNQMEPGFITWVEQHTIFCNSLVDRIVPGKPDEKTTRDIFKTVGYTDDLLTVSEVYRLWAIEGNEQVKKVLSFCQADKGVIIEPDITPYRERKLRLLNGTHTISVGLGYLYGLETVGECMQDKWMSAFITRVMQQEIVPAVPVDTASATAFANEVLDRFRNPFIVHPLINITLQYTSKMKMRNVQTLLNYYRKFNHAPKHFTLGFAAYLLFMKGEKEENGKYYGLRNETHYHINDDFASYFFSAWQKADIQSQASMHEFVRTVLSDTGIWGTDLSTLPDFGKTVADILFELIQEGVKQVAGRMVV